MEEYLESSKGEKPNIIDWNSVELWFILQQVVPLELAWVALPETWRSILHTKGATCKQNQQGIYLPSVKQEINK